MDEKPHFRDSRWFDFSWLIGILLSIWSVLVWADTEMPVLYGFRAAKAYAAVHPHSPYRIQVASFTDYRSALYAQKQWRKRSQRNVSIISKSIHEARFYAVVIGPLASRTELIHFAHQYPQYMGDLRSSYAYEVWRVDPATWWRQGLWTIAIGGGQQFPMGFSTLTVNNGSEFQAPYNQDQYSGQIPSSGVFTMYGGRTWQRDAKFLPIYTLGVMWQYLVPSQLTGQVTQYSDPTFLNYNYQLTLESNIVLAYAKADIVEWKKILPYINIGLGSAYNRGRSYQETALSGVTPRVSPGFQTNKSMTFAYLLGAGIDWTVTESMTLSVGYNYLNSGASGSGYGVGTWSGERLALDAQGSNEFLLSIAYQFDGIDLWHRGRYEDK